ncbi:hypothetical protein CAAN1_02S00584 [[Candida] anglica]|uniref:Uncharacterized protein n=1 Tax=[Candida] anglica TaxID=148631 RepID=A0ABP0E6K6_9ASCO
MACFAKVKCFVSSFVVAYIIYLLTYKCHNLNESAIEHGVKSVFHPLSHTHNQACDKLNQGVNFLQPYLSSAQSTIQSHALYKQYAVQDKVDTVSTYYATYAEKYVIQLFKLIETYEVIVATYVISLWAKIQHLYATEVAPKVKLA